MIKANLNSTTSYLIDEKGQIHGFYGLVKGRRTKKSKVNVLNYTNKSTGLRTNISITKLVYISHYPDKKILDSEIIVFKNPNLEFPYAISNLELIDRKESFNRNLKKQLCSET